MIRRFGAERILPNVQCRRRRWRPRRNVTIWEGALTWRLARWARYLRFALSGSEVVQVVELLA